MCQNGTSRRRIPLTCIGKSQDHDAERLRDRLEVDVDFGEHLREILNATQYRIYPVRGGPNTARYRHVKTKIFSQRAQCAPTYVSSETRRHNKVPICVERQMQSTTKKNKLRLSPTST